MQIYLDHSATTPPRGEVIATISKTLSQHWGNPSSLHSWGDRAATIIEKARFQVASLINSPNAESIIFTSSGTEADNLAIFGIAQQFKTPQHLIISSVEHSAIANPAKILEEWGWEITKLPVNSLGKVNPLDLMAAIQPNTALISIISGQSEVGTIQPIWELAKIARENNILFHTDAVQTAGRIAIDVQKIPIDLLSISSHKIYGSPGSGCLYIRSGVEIKPIIHGGGQELGLRSGTQAVAEIAGFGIAAELAASEMEMEIPRLIRLRDRLFELLEDCPYLEVTGDRINRLPHHASFILKNLPESVTGKTMVRELKLAGIAISAGSACHSGKISPSPILLAMGYSPSEAKQGIRLTLGRETTQADIDWTAMVLKQVIQRTIPELVTV